MTWKPAAGPGPPSPAGLSTVAGFYRYAVEEELLDHSPAAHVRRPRLDYESHATGLDRNELGALLVAAGLGPPAEHALISLLALNGLRVSEATGADIEALGVERGHRTLVITRKGGKVVTIPLAPRTARAIDLAIGERVRRADFPHLRRTAAGPARCRADRPPSRGPRRDHQAGRAAESARGAVPVLPPARFPGPLAEPAVRVSAQRALHGCCHQAGFAGGQGAGILFPR